MTNFIDLNAYDGDAAIEADICVVGAGAAGITLARSLARAKLSVVLLEAGGMELDGATQLLYSGDNTGIRYFDLTACRLRYFGGTTNHWGAYTNFNSRLDFEGRPELGLPAWPFAYDDLVPYLQRAAEMLELDWNQYAPEAHAANAGESVSDLVENTTERLATTVFQKTRHRKFSESFADDLKAQANLRVFLNANLTRVQLRPDAGAVEHFRFQSLGGKTLRVRARAYVMACHAIENARLLLASNDVVAAGVANRSDQVGRNFMDHVHVFQGELISTDQTVPPLYSNDGKRWGRFDYNYATRCVAAVTDETSRAEDMQSYYMGLHAADPGDAQFNAMLTLQDTFFEPLNRRVLSALAATASAPATSARLVGQRFGFVSRRPRTFRLDHRIDQAPNPDSRITLRDERDALGLPKINLHWDITDLDVHSFNRGQDITVAELSAAGFGRFAVRPFTKAELRENLLGHYHHLGTTRMSASPSSGVVNGDGRAHDVPNLYIAGSSTFPVAGKSGPTMSIVAMAMRMADHLTTQLEPA
ncbi:MAG: GMC family oxidoreductase [Pseudomonadota bacterium]